VINPQFTGGANPQPPTGMLNPQFTGGRPASGMLNPQFTGGQPPPAMLNPQFTGGQPPAGMLNPQFTGSAHPQFNPQFTGAYPQLNPQFTGGMVNPQFTGYPQPVYQPGGQAQPWGGTPQHQQQQQQQRQQQELQPAMAQQPVGAQPMYHTAVPIMALTQGSAPVDCPVCRKRSLTRTEFEAGNATHLWAILFCVFVGLPCIPYLMNSLKNVRHSCGSCGVHLATWNRGGNTEVFQHS